MDITTAASVAALHGLGLVDLAVVLLVAGSVIGALAGRRGLLGAIGSGLATALVCWLVAMGLLTWGSGSLRAAVADSTLVHLVGVPSTALQQARDLAQDLLHHVRAVTAGVVLPR